MKERVLVIAAHPDDELLGCGGTIALHSLVGDDVSIIIAAEGATSRGDINQENIFENETNYLKECSQNAAALLGVKNVKMLELPDNRMDSLDRLDLIKLIEFNLNRIKPTVVYTHHSGDLNVDHRRLHEAVVTACRPKPNFFVKRILTFETLSSTEWQSNGNGAFFQPNWYVDISSVLEKKINALSFYESEICDWPHPRSKEAIAILAKYRGSQVGKNAAEGFFLLRNIQ